MSLAFGWAAAAELPELRAFVLRTYGPGSAQAAPGRLDWLAAHPDGLHVTTCRAAGALVAACVHLPVRVALDGEEVAAAWGVDFMVDPAWRGRGIGRRFLDLRLERFPAGLSSGQSPPMARLYERAGGNAVGPFFKAVCVRRPSARGPLRAVARDWLAWGLRAARAAGPAGRRPLDVPAAAALAAALAPRLAPGEAGPANAPAVFAWRFGGPAYPDYACWEIAAGAARGLVVTRAVGREEIVVDVHARPADLAAVLRATARTSPAARLACPGHGRRLARALRAAGWLVRPAAGRFVTMSSDPGLAGRLAGRPWLLFAAESDLDLLRPPAAAA